MLIPRELFFRISALLFFAGFLHAQTLTTLTDFPNFPNNGSGPSGNLVIGADGQIYGLTGDGGAASKFDLDGGTLFSLTPAAGKWNEAVLYNFFPYPTSPIGILPPSGVVSGADGVLYGTAAVGGALANGTVFSFTPPRWTPTLLHDFEGGPSDGSSPYGSLIVGREGELFGTTEGGGSGSAGTVFSLTPPTTPTGPWTKTLLHQFTCEGASQPFAGLVMGPNGVLYGTALTSATSSGCGSGGGGVFSLTPPVFPGDPWTYQLLYSFSGGSDGATPYGGLVIGENGVLFGTTFFGGSADYGAVFSLEPLPDGQWSEKVLHSFTGVDGMNPQVGLILGHCGVLYGTTVNGGAGSYGTVFSLTPPARSSSSWTEIVLHNFTFGIDGGNPGLLVAGPNGMLYGTTSFGGIAGNGTVFSLQP